MTTLNSPHEQAALSLHETSSRASSEASTLTITPIRYRALNPNLTYPHEGPLNRDVERAVQHYWACLNANIPEAANLVARVVQGIATLAEYEYYWATNQRLVDSFNASYREIFEPVEDAVRKHVDQKLKSGADLAATTNDITSTALYYNADPGVPRWGRAGKTKKILTIVGLIDLLIGKKVSQERAQAFVVDAALRYDIEIQSAAS